MTLRSIVIGLSLTLLIACGTYFNDWVIRQTMLIATHFPAVVFGTIALLLLTLGPICRLLGCAPLRPAEVAVIAVLALAACGLPGSGFWRYHGTLWTMPAHWNKTSPSWHAQRVMSYLPGGSGLLAPGHVRDPGELARRIVNAAESGDTNGVAARLWVFMDDAGQRATRDVAATTSPTPEQVRAMLRATDAGMNAPELLNVPSDGPTGPSHEVTRHNRALLVAEMPDLIAPLPLGGDVLVANGQADPHAIDALVTGVNSGRAFPVDQVPWAAWWPTLRLWGGAMLCLVIASLCIALIVHPQWSRRELLAYPIARFVEEISRPAESASGASGGGGLPAVATRPHFWVALGLVFGIHLLNGLHAYYPDVPRVMLSMPFTNLREAFPNAYRVPLSYGLFEPRIFFSVVAFAFFLSRSVSLSLGLAQVLYIAVGAMMLSAGIPWEYEKVTPTKTGFLRLGAYLAFAALIAYTGRRYYANVIASALGAARHAETPAFATWAARLSVVFIALAVALLVSAGMAWDLALVLVLLLLMIWIVLSRILCETGAFMVTIPFMPIAAMSGLLGFEAMGPTGFLMVGLASWALIADPREAVMPYLATGLQIADRAGGGGRGLRLPRIALWQAGVLVAVMVVAGVVTLTLEYELGVARANDSYAMRFAPASPFNELARRAAEMQAAGTLVSATEVGPIERLGRVNPTPGSVAWVTLGFVLVATTAAARLRLPWWPIHPVLFLVWGTYANAHFAFSFLLGWLVKTAVVGSGGARAYETAKPVMIGMIAAELLAALLWTIIGAVYYFRTGQPPVSYFVFPS